MEIPLSDIDHIAHLAQLALTDQERSAMQHHLSAFFATVEAMRAIDTQGVEPLTQPLAAVRAVALRLRPDVASEPDQRSANQRSAPAVTDGLFLVPRVIE